MSKLLTTIKSWCYGGKDDTFFHENKQTINAYNSKMLLRVDMIFSLVLIVLTILSMFLDFYAKARVYYAFFTFAFILISFAAYRARRDDGKYAPFLVTASVIVIFAFIITQKVVLKDSDSIAIFATFLAMSSLVFIMPMCAVVPVLIVALTTFICLESAVGVDDATIFRNSIQLSVCVCLSIFIGQEKLKRQIDSISYDLLLQEKGFIDGLTGIRNRRYLNEKLYNSFGPSEDIGAAMFDIDFFKQFNTQYGHPKGDEAIQGVADALSSALKPYNVELVRYGGEEFCFIVNGFYARNTIAGIVEDCVRSIRKAEIEFQKTGDFIDAHPESFIPRDRHAERFVTVSVGYAVFEPSNKLTNETAEDRVRRCVDSADQALQRAKDKHRNCICKYNSKTDQR